MAVETLVTTNDFDANAPATADDVIVVDYNTQNVNAGLNQAGDYYASLTFAEGYEHDIGSSGTYLQCNSAIVRDLSGGNTWLKSDDNNGAGSQLMGDVVIQKMRNDNHVYLTSAATQHADSVWQRLSLKRGIIDIEAAMEFGSGAEVTVGYVTNRAGDCVVNMAAESGDGDAIPNLTIEAGRVISDRTITRCTIANAHLIQNTKPITMLVIQNGGVVEYEHTAGTDIIVEGGGHLILAGRNRAKTITRIRLLEGARITGYNADLHDGGTLIDFRQGAR